MNKRILLWVFLAVVCVAIAGCRSADEDQGSIVYQAVGPDGEPAPELVVTDAGGKELRRMELPAEVSILFPFQFPLSGHVLYEDALGTQEWFLVDVVSDEVQELGSLGLGQDRARPCAFSSDPILLCGEEGIYLLSVDTAQISTVPIELDSTSPVPPLVEWVSPDEAYFLVRVSGGLWLVSAATPGASRRLGLAEGARGASFSDDSAFVEWTYVDLETKTVEKLDGLKGYHKVYGPALPRWLFLTDELVNSQEEHIASLDLKTGEVHTHISIENAIAFNFVGLTQDGRVGLVYAATESGGMELWLLVAERDGGVLLAESFTVSGRLSPNGEWVVLGERQGKDAQSMTIKLIATDSGEEKEIGEGVMPVWTKP